MEKGNENNNQIDWKNLLSLKEAARLSGYHQDYLSYLIRNDQLHGIRIGKGGKWFTTTHGLYDLLSEKKPENLIHLAADERFESVGQVPSENVSESDDGSESSIGVVDGATDDQQKDTDKGGVDNISQILSEQNREIKNQPSSKERGGIKYFFDENKVPVISAGALFVLGLIVYLGFLFIFSDADPIDPSDIGEVAAVEPASIVIEGSDLSPRQLIVNGTLRLGGPVMMQYSDTPDTAEAGQFYLDSEDGRLHIYNGDVWEPLYFEDDDFLSSLVTGEELLPFITIEDIPGFATPEDLALLATLDDLEDKVDLQPVFPGTPQVGNINITGAIAAESLDLSLADGGLILGDGFIEAAGISVEAEEISLLSGRGGVLVDSLNVGEFAISDVASGSGMELLVDGVSLVTDCGAGQVLKWSGTVWDCDSDQTGSSGAPTNAEYLVLSPNGSLSNERIFSVNATNLSLVDGGSNSNITLDTIQGISTTSTPQFAGLSLGTPSLNELLTVDGRMSLLETTTPTSTSNYGKLYVRSDDNDLYFMDSLGNEINISTVAAGTISGSGSDGQITFWTGSNTISGDSNFFWNDTDKRLGIGTSTPQFNLDVAGTGRFTGELTLDTELGVSSGGTGVSSLSDILGTSNQVSVTGGAASVIGGDVTLSLEQDIHTGASPQFAGLSLGTPSLNELLTVDGRMSLLETTTPTSTSNYGKLYVRSDDNDLYFMDSSGDEINISGIAAGSISGSGSDGQITFWTGSNTLSGDSDFFWDDVEKRLGIGVPNPTSTLAVSGDVHFQSSGGGAGLFYDQADNRLGLGTIAPNELLTVNGRMSLLETTTPTSTSNYGKLYVKNSDNELYFMNSTGTEINISGSAAGGLTGNGAEGQVTFWTASNAISGTNDFFWDNAENKLGIGTSNPLRTISLGDPGTGLDRPATSTLAFYSEDTERLRIGAEGNIGVALPGGFSEDYEVLLGEPDTSPGGTGRGADFSSDGTYLAISSDSSPFINIYKKDGDEFNFLSTPPSSDRPTGSARDVSFSPDGTYLAVAHDQSPFVTIYKRDGDTFSKLSDPADLPGGSGRGIAFSPNGRYLVVGHDDGSFVTIYKRDGDTFNKLSDPTDLPPDNARRVTFSPDGTYLVVGNASTAPFLTIYKRDGDTFNKLPDPADEPLSHGFGVAFSPDNSYLAIAHAGTPFLTIYKRDGDTFEKLPDPATSPDSTGNDVVFSPDGNHLAIAHNSGSFFTVYKRDGDTFNALSPPPSGDEPAGTGNGIAFSPEGSYLSIANSNSPSATIYKGGGSSVHTFELASHVSSGRGLAIGKELKLYRSRPGVLSLGSGSSFSVDGGNLYVDRTLGIGTDSPMGLFDAAGHLVVRASGFVGIATSTPQTELHVEGTIRQSNAVGCDLRANASGDVECIVSTQEAKKNIEQLTASDHRTFLDAVRSQNLYSFIYNDMDDEENPYLGIMFEDTKNKDLFFSKEGEKFRTMNYASVMLGAMKALAEDMEEMRFSINENGRLTDKEGKEVEGSESSSTAFSAKGVLYSLLEFSETRLQRMSSRLSGYFGRTIDIVFADNSVIENESGTAKTYSLQTSRQEVMINGSGELKLCAEYYSENQDSCKGFIEYISGEGEDPDAFPEEDEVVAVVMFDPLFSTLLNEDHPVRVMLTPTAPLTGNIYVAHRSIYGFVVMQAGGADAGLSFDWLAVARIADGNQSEVEAFDMDDVLSDETTENKETVEEKDLDTTEESPEQSGADNEDGSSSDAKEEKDDLLDSDSQEGAESSTSTDDVSTMPVPDTEEDTNAPKENDIGDVEDEEEGESKEEEEEEEDTKEDKSIE